MNNAPNEARITRLRSLWEIKETEYLLEIWEKHDTQEWAEEVFEVIQEILKDRAIELPEHIHTPQAIKSPDAPEINSLAIQYLKNVEDYLDAQDLDCALEACDLAIQAAPQLGIAQYYRGLVFDELGQLENAIAAYQEAVRLDPQLEDAIEALRSAEMEFDKTYQLPTAQRHLDQAVTHGVEGELENALQACDLAIQIMPRFAHAHNYRGMILEEMGQLEDAILAYREAARFNTEFYAARENLCQARIAFEYQRYRYKSEENHLVIGEDDEFQFTGEIPDSHFPEDGLEAVAEPDELYPEIPALYLDEKAMLLAGWPGHRTRPGRSGYDPLDYQYEWAHMQGVMIRLMFTGKFRTHNPVYLLMMYFYGVLFTMGLVLGFTAPSLGIWDRIMMVSTWGLYLILGIPLLINVYLSLKDIKNDIQSDQGKEFY